MEISFILMSLMLSFFGQFLFAFDPETPPEVAQFVLISEAKEAIDTLIENNPAHQGKTFENLPPQEQDELLKSVARVPDATSEQLEGMKQMLKLLPGLTH